MRRILFAMIALGALAWMAAPASAHQYRSFRGGDSWGWNQGGHDHGHNHGRSSWRRFSRWGNGYGNHRGSTYGGGNHGGNRFDGQGGSFGNRY